MKNDWIKPRLKSVPLFRELSDHELNSLVTISQVHIYKPRTFVFMQGDPLERVFFIHSGTVKIYKTDVNGKEQIVSILQAGEMFPHTGFFRKGAYPAHAEAVEETTLIAIPISDFEQTLICYPELCMKLFRVMGEKIIDLQNRLEEQILHNTYEQIVMLLLRLTKTNAVPQGRYFRFTTHFTNRELANMIGTSRETISRTLSHLKRKGLIDIDDDGFYLIDVERLEKEIFL
ncbi:CRP/FNR family transcriptional regulator [Anoxybacillus vitaminiphilus]|uniref:CRP/FNR family transcriptional regulator n=1 Tax=Paranoxybacillus vitaminiphilus TaxID=581036 RepID=A0A327YFE0_9BACL|nr:Crp/Fnr family transcriptional regulator [Anoxybacillus vitaminiphilus]RAK19574.1 CRP/FNR family transcriptional regulator [Anoxybacillus vitaminiphilus]